MKELNFFNLYLDKIYFDSILTLLNISNYYLNIFIISFFLAVSFGLFGHSKHSISRKALIYFIFTIPLIFSFINYYFSIFINYYGFLIFSILVCFSNYNNITKKSLKYIVISTVIFSNIILFIYNFAINIVFNQILSLYSHFGLTSFEILTKDFFSIYKPGENLFSSNFLIDNLNFSFENNIIFKRVYFFYYFLHNFVILFWFFVFSLVIRTHGIRIFK